MTGDIGRRISEFLDPSTHQEPSWTVAVRVPVIVTMVACAGLNWLLISIDGMCIDGIQTNCGDRLPPLLAAATVSVGGLVALIMNWSPPGSRRAMIGAAVWVGFVVCVMVLKNAAEHHSPDRWVGAIGWIAMMSAPAWVYILLARTSRLSQAGGPEGPVGRRGR